MKTNVKTGFLLGVIGTLSILTIANLPSYSLQSAKHDIALNSGVTKDAIGLCNTHGGILCALPSNG